MTETPITYWIRVSESAYQDSAPEEIQGFMAKGFIPDIRIMPVLETSRV